MIALIITSAILALIAVVLFSPVSLRFSYRDGNITATAHYLFIKFDFSPDAFTEMAAKKSGKKTDKKPVEKEKDAKKADDSSGMDKLKTVLEFVRASKEALGIIRRHLIFYKTVICISISGPDPYETGVCFGRVSSFVYVFLSVINGIFTLKNPKVYIAPDFLRGKSLCDISFRVRILMLFLVWAGGDAAFRFIKISLRDKRKRQKIKGGKKHEPTTAASN